MMMGSYDDALQDARESVRLDAGLAKVNLILRLLLVSTRLLEKKKTQLQNTIVFFLMQGYVRIAKCCLALGDSAAALNAINKAVELEPTVDLANEKRNIQALQAYADDSTRAYEKGDYRKVHSSRLL